MFGERILKALSGERPVSSVVGVLLALAGPSAVGEGVEADIKACMVYKGLTKSSVECVVDDGPDEVVDDVLKCVCGRLERCLKECITVVSPKGAAADVVLVTGSGECVDLCDESYELLCVFGCDFTMCVYDEERRYEYCMVEMRGTRRWTMAVEHDNSSERSMMVIPEGSFAMLRRKRCSLDVDDESEDEDSIVDDEHDEETKEMRQAMIHEYMGDENRRLNDGEDVIDVILDQTTDGNILYNEYNNVIRDMYTHGGRLALVAPTGSGKTRLGMISTVMAAMDNIASEREGSDRRRLVVIACPYRVIASNFFMKMSRTRVVTHGEGRTKNIRPLTGKLLISDNVEGNKLNMLSKKRVSAKYAKVSIQEYEDMFCKAYKVEENGVMRLGNKVTIDFVVGSYEMIDAFMDKMNLVNEAAIGNIEVHAVFDEFQEAFKSREKRFVTAARVFDRLAYMCKSFLVISGSYSMLDDKTDNKMSSILGRKFNVLSGYDSRKKEHVTEKKSFDIRIVPTTSKAVHRCLKGFNNKAINVLNSLTDLYTRDSNGNMSISYTHGMNRFIREHPYIVSVADCLAHPEKGTSIVMLNDKKAAEGIMDAVLCCLSCIQQECISEGRDIREWALPIYDRDMLVMDDKGGVSNVYKMSSSGKHIFSKFVDTSDGRILACDRLRHLQDTAREVRMGHEFTGKSRMLEEAYKEINELRRSLEDYKPRVVLNSPMAFKKIMQDGRKKVSVNMSTTSYDSEDIGSRSRLKYKVVVYSVSNLWRRCSDNELADGYIPWEDPLSPLSLSKSMLMEYDVYNMSDVKTLATMALMFVNNASEDYATALEDELQSVRRSPRVWVATQKIGIGADLPNIRRVITLQGKFPLTNELTDQVLGRCDRERVSRIYHSEEVPPVKRYGRDMSIEQYMSTDNAIFIAGYFITKQQEGPIAEYLHDDSTRHKIFMKEVMHTYVRCVKGLSIADAQEGRYVTDTFISICPLDKDKKSMEGVRDSFGLVYNPWVVLRTDRLRVEEIITNEEYSRDFEFERVLRNIVDSSFDVSALPYSECKHVDSFDAIHDFDGEEDIVPCHVCLMTNFYKSSYSKNIICKDIAKRCIMREIYITDSKALYIAHGMCGITNDPLRKCVIRCESGLLVKKEIVRAVTETVKGLSLEQCVGLFMSLTELMLYKTTLYDRNDTSGKRMLQHTFALNELNRTGKSTEREDIFGGIRDQCNIDSDTQWITYAEAAVFIMQPYVMLEKKMDSYMHSFVVSEARILQVAAKTAMVVNFLRNSTLGSLNDIAGNRQYKGDSAMSTSIRMMEQAVGISAAARRAMESTDTKQASVTMDELQGTANMKMIFLIKLADKISEKAKLIMKKAWGNEKKVEVMCEYFNDNRFKVYPLFNAWSRRKLFEIGGDIDIDESWSS